MPTGHNRLWDFKSKRELFFNGGVIMTNEVIETMTKRFSCRSFAETAVSKEQIEAILHAAKFAPNGKNEQSWHFTVVQSEKGKELLRTAAGETPPPGFLEAFPDGKWPFQGDFCGAPVVILVSGRTDVPWPQIGPVLAVGNMMNAATSLGLATLWSTVFTRDLFRDEKSSSVRNELLPEDNELYAAIFLGYPTSTPESRAPRREGVETWI